MHIIMIYKYFLDLAGWYAALNLLVVRGLVALPVIDLPEALIFGFIEGQEVLVP